MEKMEGHPDGCKCDMCQGKTGHCCHHHRIWRIVLAIFIVALAFWAGARYGELRAFMGGYGGYGYGMMGGWNNGYGYGGMMRAWNEGYGYPAGTIQVQGTASSASTSPAAKAR